MLTPKQTLENLSLLIGKGEQYQILLEVVEGSRPIEGVKIPDGLLRSIQHRDRLNKSKKEPKKTTLAWSFKTGGVIVESLETGTKTPFYHWNALADHLGCSPDTIRMRVKRCGYFQDRFKKGSFAVERATNEEIKAAKILHTPIEGEYHGVS